MHRRIGILVVVSVLVLLFAGMSYAAVCGGKWVCVKHPNGTEDYDLSVVPPAWPKLPLYAGQVYKIKLGFDYTLATNSIAAYKLSYSCLGSDYLNPDGSRIWKSIGETVSCSPAVGICSPDYYWTVPDVQVDLSKPIRYCKVRVDAFDKNGHPLARDPSDKYFKIYPFSGIPVPSVP